MSAMQFVLLDVARTTRFEDSAMVGAVSGMSLDENCVLLEQILTDRGIQTQQVSDEERLLKEIWESVVYIERGRTETVSELLSEGYRDYVEGDAALVKVGIKKVDARGSEPQRIFFVQSAIQRHLLKDSEFRHLEIDQILSRIPGARRDCRQRMGSGLPRGICIPVASIQKLLSGEEDSEEPNTANGGF